MRAVWLVANRLLWLLPVIVGLVALTFVISHIIPADPAALAAGENASPAQIAAVRAQLGLDRPLYYQLGHYLLSLCRGDLGTSALTGRPIAQDLAERLPATIELTIAAAALALVFGVPLGVLAAM